ncbi:MAG TPA: hypothetical protein VNV66_22515, partial [Pilimelia sp.]|nr:hypothetical protein [Pilimelia sp.]
SHSWTERDLASDPDGAEVSAWLLGYGLRRLAELGEEWLATRAHWSPEWRDAVDWSDYGVRLTAHQAKALNEELGAVLERYRRLPPAEDSRTVLYYVYSFPQGPPP